MLSILYRTQSTYCTVVYCTSQFSVLYCTALYCTVLYCTVLYCTALYCTALYCTILYCTILHCAALSLTISALVPVLYCRGGFNSASGGEFFGMNSPESPCGVNDVRDDEGAGEEVIQRLLETVCSLERSCHVTQRSLEKENIMLREALQVHILFLSFFFLFIVVIFYCFCFCFCFCFIRFYLS